MLTASKRHCWMVWTNYGIGRNMFFFLSEHERITFQQANKFAYDVAISRVDTRINLFRNAYFTWSDGGRLDKTILKVNLSTMQTQELKCPKSNRNWVSVQVGYRSIYQQYDNQFNQFRQLSEHNGVISVHKKTKPLRGGGMGAALCNFNDKSLVLTGGGHRVA